MYFTVLSEGRERLVSIDENSSEENNGLMETIALLRVVDEEKQQCSSKADHQLHEYGTSVT